MTSAYAPPSWYSFPPYFTCARPVLRRCRLRADSGPAGCSPCARRASGKSRCGRTSSWTTAATTGCGGGASVDVRPRSRLCLWRRCARCVWRRTRRWCATQPSTVRGAALSRASASARHLTPAPGKLSLEARRLFLSALVEDGAPRSPALCRVRALTTKCRSRRVAAQAAPEVPGPLAPPRRVGSRHS